MPPDIEDLVPLGHPALSGAEYVHSPDRLDRTELELAPEGVPLGAPACHPHAPGAAERAAAWIHDEGASLLESGSGLSGPDTVPVAHRMATSRPQHVLAVLPEASVEGDCYRGSGGSERVR